MKTKAIYFAVILSISPGAASSGTLQELGAKFAKDVKNPDIKIAVMDFEANGNSRDSVVVRERITTFLAQSNSISLVERSLVEKILQEQRMQLSGALGPDEAKTIGKLSGANAIVTGTLSKLANNKIELNARVIRVETGEVLSAGQAVFRKDWEDIDQFYVDRELPYEFKPSVLPEIRSADLPPESGVLVPRAQAPSQLSVKQTGVSFGNIDMEAIVKYNDAVQVDKSTTPPYDKFIRWKMFGEHAPAYKTIADERAEEWHRYAETAEVAEALAIDKSTALPALKASNWDRIGVRYPAIRLKANERSSQWKRYATELSSIADKKNQRLALAEQDYKKLKRLLSCQ